METKTDIETARATYLMLRNVTCTGDVFAGLPTRAQFDAAVHARLSDVSNPTPAQFVEAAKAVNLDLVGRSNFRDALERGTVAARRPRKR